MTLQASPKVHLRSLDAREQCTLLSTRTALVRRLRDIESSVRGMLRGFGFRFLWGPKQLRLGYSPSRRLAKG
jgi:hypothetical protein